MNVLIFAEKTFGQKVAETQFYGFIFFRFCIKNASPFFLPFTHVFAENALRFYDSVALKSIFEKYFL